jgi:hypothetical protein
MIVLTKDMIMYLAIIAQVGLAVLLLVKMCVIMMLLRLKDGDYSPMKPIMVEENSRMLKL